MLAGACSSQFNCTLYLYDLSRIRYKHRLSKKNKIKIASGIELNYRLEGLICRFYLGYRISLTLNHIIEEEIHKGPRLAIFVKITCVEFMLIILRGGGGGGAN